jgi:NADPH:quinone reductase-like Zn-dependent oxidoreductase
MKAIVWTKYGSPEGLVLREVEKPAPKDNEVLIRVHAATVTAGDREIRSLTITPWLRLPIRLYMGVLKPRNKILGQELAGEVEAVGKEVTQFKVGDPVFGTTGLRLGAYAEYICLPAAADGSSALAIKPTTMSYEEAAAVPTAGLEALHHLRKANIQRGQSVLVYGAGGSIGTFTVQLAKHFGAEVTAVDRAGKLDMLRSIGADQVIDYQKEDFTQNGETYDIILDVVGKSPFAGSIQSLKPNGCFLTANPGLSHMVRGWWTARTSSKKVMLGPASPSHKDLTTLKELIEAGKLKSVIDRRYPLEQTAEAHRYADSGQKKGNIVITVVQQP